MTSIEFNQTSNVFLNTGIIALHHYLEKCAEDNRLLGYPIDRSNFHLEKDKLTISHEKLFQLLEDVYYLMGREVYDTATEKQREEKANAFLKETVSQDAKLNERFGRFPAIETIGLTDLIRNNAAGKTRNPNNLRTIKDFIKVDEIKNKNIKIKDLTAEDSIKPYLKISELEENLRKIQNKIKVQKNSSKLEQLKNEEKAIIQDLSRIPLIIKFIQYFNANELNLQQQLYFNEPYTKIKILEPITDSCFEQGDKTCSLTGFKRKELFSNPIPFVPEQGKSKTFKSHSQVSIDNVSWEAMYLAHFAPKYCYYKYYTNKIKDRKREEGIICFLVNINNLILLKDFHEKYDLLVPNELWKSREINYNYNFNLYHFSKQKKAEEIRKADFTYTEHSELLFMLAFTIYKKVIAKNKQENEGILKFLKRYDLVKKLSVISFKAEPYSQTLRLSEYQEFDDFHFLVQLLGYLQEKHHFNDLKFSQLLQGFEFKNAKFQSPRIDYQIKMRMSHQIRNTVLNKIIKKQSILSEVESLFHKCFSYLITDNTEKVSLVGYKNYSAISEFVNIYEPLVYAKNNLIMKENFETIRQRAVNLGNMIGNALIGDKNISESKKRDNIRKAKKYLYDLRNSRNFEQLLKALNRIQESYPKIIVTKEDLLLKLDYTNYNIVKQFILLEAYNQINLILSPIPEKNNSDNSKNNNNNDRSKS